MKVQLLGSSVQDTPRRQFVSSFLINYTVAVPSVLGQVVLGQRLKAIPTYRSRLWAGVRSHGVRLAALGQRFQDFHREDEGAGNRQGL